jgi:hypothetical protein
MDSFTTSNKSVETKGSNNTPQVDNKFTPLVLAAQGLVGRNYIPAEEMMELAINHYRNKKGKGITLQYLIEKGLAKHKKQAQDTLKYHFRKGTLFTLEDKRPQQYYPTSIKSEIIQNLGKNTPINPTGVAMLLSLPLPTSSSSPLSCSSRSPLSQSLEYLTLHTLEGYVLPLLPKAPLFIHNMHFKTKISPECYKELNLPYYKNNYGKYHTEVIGNTHVDYVFYASGIVNVDTKCSTNPYRLQTEEDRDRLIVLLCDKHERLVPDIMDWHITEADINKDIKVSELFHFTAIKVQVRHLDHLFRIYVKSMGKDTVCRIEENKHPKKPAIEFINDVFNPVEKLEKHFVEYTKQQELDADQKGGPEH